jgi:hypothetical protein|nr:MAG TPA_asm: hypothetical protein [Caudoviricetes sp.]
MNFTKDDITEEFENNLLELFLDKLSETPSKILNDEGDLMYTNYEALEVLQKVFEIIMQEDDFKIISKTLGE